MREGLGRAGFLSAAIALVLSVATALGASSGRSVERESVTIEPQTQGSAFPECRGGTDSTGIGLEIDSKGPTDTFWINSAGVNPGKNSFVFVDNATSGRRKLEATVLCRRGSFTKKTKLASIDSTFGTVKARCPRGSVVVGGGVLSSGPYDSQQVLQSRPDGKRVWLARVYNRNGTAVVTATAVCAKNGRYQYETDRGNSKPLSARAARTQFFSYKAEAKCGNGNSTISGGFAIEDSAINLSVTGSRPTGERNWTAEATGSDSSESIKSYAVCAKD